MSVRLEACWQELLLPYSYRALFETYRFLPDVTAYEYARFAPGISVDHHQNALWNT